MVEPRIEDLRDLVFRRMVSNGRKLIELRLDRGDGSFDWTHIRSVIPNLFELGSWCVVYSDMVRSLKTAPQYGTTPEDKEKGKQDAEEIHQMCIRLLADVAGFLSFVSDQMPSVRAYITGESDTIKEDLDVEDKEV